NALSQLLDSRIFDHESASSGCDGALQISATTKRRQNHYSDIVIIGQGVLVGWGRAVDGGDLDIHNGDITGVIEDRLDHTGTIGQLGHDVQIIFQVQQRGQPGADQVLVIGQQDANGHSLTSTRVPGTKRMSFRVPPAETARRWSPAKPWWAAGLVSKMPTPSSSTRSNICPSHSVIVMVQVVA